MLFFLKSSLCLTLLWGFYQLVLAKEKSFHFNRYYLLGICVFSLSVPFVTITQYVDASPLVSEIFSPTTAYTTGAEFSITEILLVIYISVCFILLGRFIFNILTLARRIQTNKVIHFHRYSIVLINQDIVPHTFFNYIFVNTSDFKNQQLEKELLTHELLHISQKHTIDILFTEFLHIVFWINPVWIFLKKSIRLNHEYLADMEVVNTYDNISEYQHLLVSKTARIHNNYLASNLNFLLTKKRLIMMTKPVSQGRTLLKQLLIIPLLICFIYAFSSKVYAQKTATKHEQVHKNQSTKDAFPPPPSSEIITIHEEEKQGYGTISIGNETYYYKTKKGIKTYYDQHGTIVESKKIKNRIPPPPPKIRKNTKLPNKMIGSILVDGERYYYKKEKKHYYDKYGNKVPVTSNNESGSIRKKGKTYFYKTKNNNRQYYDKYGNLIDADKMKELSLPPCPPPLPMRKH